MDDAKAKAILKTILDAAGGRTGRPILIRDLVFKLGISHEEADDLSEDLIASGLAWGCIEEGAKPIRETFQICVSRKGRHLVDGFPDPNPDPDSWFRLPNEE
jgi:hypothetical protein